MARQNSVGSAAVVTGHSRGLGEAIAAHLLSRDVRVLGVARGGTAALARRHGATLREVQLDLADSSALADWLKTDALRQALADAELVLLVNNAGVVQPTGPLESQHADDVARAVAVNVSAALMLSAAFAVATRDARDRRILQSFFE